MTSLIDPYSRTIDYLRLAVTDRCNLRCLYCMPEEGLQLLRHEDILSYEEILRLLKICIQAGISKVRLTGGEPLVRKDLDYLISQISKLQPSLDISLTTNGLLLSKQAESLAAAGLKRVNISIDSLDPDTYRRITRTGNLSQVLSGLEAAIAAGLEPVKINVVVLKHVNEELEAFVELARRLRGSAVTANAFHPGLVRTRLDRNLPWPLRLPVLGYAVASLLGPWLLPWFMRLVYCHPERLIPEAVAGYAPPYRDLSHRLALRQVCRQLEVRPLEEIADLLQISTPAVWLWVKQFNRQGPEGLSRAGRGGRARRAVVSPIHLVAHLSRPACSRRSRR